MLVLVVLLLACLLVVAVATSLQSSTTSRSYARVVLTRSALDAATSAFAEVSLILNRSARGDRRADDGEVDWKRELTPPYGRIKPRDRLSPARTRGIFKKTHGLWLSDVELHVVHWVDLSKADQIVKGHGVLELAVSVSGSRSWLAERRTVRRRVQFYCRQKPVIDWGSSTPPGPGNPASQKLENCDVVILTLPLATVIDE